MRSKVKTNRGISMVELLIAIVIVSILAALAVPNFGGAIRKIRFNNVSANVLSSVRYARSAAISTQKPHGVFFNTSEKKMITFCDYINPGAGTYELGDSVVRVDTLDAKISFLGTNFPNHTIIFRPDGTAAQTGDVFCYGSGAVGYASFSINVTAGTGRAKLERYN